MVMESHTYNSLEIINNDYSGNIKLVNCIIDNVKYETTLILSKKISVDIIMRISQRNIIKKIIAREVEYSWSSLCRYYKEAIKQKKFELNMLCDQHGIELEFD